MTSAISPQKSSAIKPPLIDEWSVREKLALASAVDKQGDQNWYSVARTVKMFAEENRPDDWFSTKNCALQYDYLLEKVGGNMPNKRSKRGERGDDTPQQLIVRELTQQRLEELKKGIEIDTEKYKEIKMMYTEAFSENPSEEFLRKVWQMKLDEERKKKEEEAKFEEFCKQRDERIKEVQKKIREARLTRTPSRTPSAPGTPVSLSLITDSSDVPGEQQPLTSPLLTSLLKNAGSASPSKGQTPGFFTAAQKQLSPVAVSPVKDTTSGGAPTLSRLLELSPSSSGQKIPALPVVEQPTETDAPPAPTEDKADATSAKVQDNQQTEGKVEVKTEPTEDPKTPAPRRRGRQSRGVTTKEATPASSSAAVQTRRSTRQRTPKVETDFEGDKNAPNTPVDVSEESMDSSIRGTSLRLSSSKAPSVIDSVPNSPASSTMQSEDMEALKEYKKFLGNLKQIWSLAKTHKHFDLFLKPVTNREVDGYEDTVKRPMDLTTMKRKLDLNADDAYQSTTELQRDMMLMFRNAQMYNPPSHDVYVCAKEMEDEILAAIEAQIASEVEDVKPPTTGGKIHKVDVPEVPPGTTTPPTQPQPPRRGRPPKTRTSEQQNQTPSTTSTPTTSSDHDMISRRRSRTSVDTESAVSSATNPGPASTTATSSAPTAATPTPAGDARPTRSTKKKTIS